MDTPIYGVMGVSTCNEKDEWKYYVAVASTKETNEFDSLLFRLQHGLFSTKKDL